MEEKDNTVWEKAKKNIKDKIASRSFDMWIKPLVLKDIQDNACCFLCSNAFFKNQVEKSYKILIEEELEKICNRKIILNLDIQKPLKKNSFKYENIVKKEAPEIPNLLSNQGRYLRENLTFNNFVTGKSNDFAYKAACLVSSNDSAFNNSLFLLSDTGLGKTHLSQAIGHKIFEERPKEKVYYITAEEFTNEMVSSIKSNTMDDFKDKYRKNCDTLILENVHFLSNKNSTQNELVLTLDFLLNANKKIIFSSLYSPNNIPKLNDELKSRFSSSIVSMIKKPDYETRLKILEHKAKGQKVFIKTDVLEFLAEELTENVRQLETGINNLVVKSQILNRQIDISLAKSIIEQISIKKDEIINIETIKDLVCQEFRISTKEIESKSKNRSIVIPRQIAMFLSRKYTDFPLQKIGKSFNKYHASVMYAEKIISNHMRNKGKIFNQVNYISKKLEQKI